MSFPKYKQHDFEYKCTIQIGYMQDDKDKKTTEKRIFR